MHLAVPPPARQSITTEDERLIRDHLGLVGCVVAEIVARIPRHVDRDDLLSAATVGLVQAARSFDPDRGISFQSYARIRIRGAVVDELRSRDWASRSVRHLARRAESAADALALRLGRSPTQAEVADGLGIDPEVLCRLAADVQRATTINYEGLVLTGDADALLPADVDTPQEALLERERRGYLRDAIVSLPPRLRRVVVGYFFEERPIAALAAELGVSESRISQMRAEAVALLRDAMNAHLEPVAPGVEHRPRGRVARRKAAYYDAVGSASGYRARLDARPRPLTQRVALAGVG
ncbi:MAG: sigma-70 family RNA polymerase sigma factor, partial [Actinomycetota bacterium]|nr:sigma-70 family RNA polymerase sigma factor [Actinomycetota bacterium]